MPSSVIAAELIPLPPSRVSTPIAVASLVRSVDEPVHAIVDPLAEQIKLFKELYDPFSELNRNAEADSIIFSIYDKTTVFFEAIEAYERNASGYDVTSLEKWADSAIIEQQRGQSAVHQPPVGSASAEQIAFAEFLTAIRLIKAGLMKKNLAQRSLELTCNALNDGSVVFRWGEYIQLRNKMYQLGASLQKRADSQEATGAMNLIQRHWKMLMSHKMELSSGELDYLWQINVLPGCCRDQRMKVGQPVYISLPHERMSIRSFPKQYERLAGGDKSADDGSAPGGARYLTDAHSVCPRLTALDMSDLLFIDKVTLCSQRNEAVSDEDHQELRDLFMNGKKLGTSQSSPTGLLFRLGTWSRYASYVLLSFSRRQKNVNDNKLFTRGLREEVEQVTTILAARAIASRPQILVPVSSMQRNGSMTGRGEIAASGQPPPSASDDINPDLPHSSAKKQDKRSMFVILGWFPDSKKLGEPVEICANLEDFGYFLPDLKKHITGLRGWRSLLSFKTVQAFGLYKCSCLNNELAHSVCDTSDNDDLQIALVQLFRAVDKSYERHGKIKQDNPEDPEFLKRQDSESWAIWVHKNLNEGRSCPFRSEKSLLLILRWSRVKIVIASAVPLILSLIIGLWYNAVEADVQGAYTIAGYVVTAGAFVVAAIAILTTLSDGATKNFWKGNLRSGKSTVFYLGRRGVPSDERGEDVDEMEVEEDNDASSSSPSS